MDDREKLNNGSEEAGEYTLESILAEYKSSAYILGEKKLSKEELEKQAGRILREMTKGPTDIAHSDEDEDVDRKRADGSELDKNKRTHRPNTRQPEQMNTMPARHITTRHSEKTKSPVKISDENKPEQRTVYDRETQANEERKNVFKRKKQLESTNDAEINKEPNDKNMTDPEQFWPTEPKKGDVVKAAKKDEPDKFKKSDYKAEKELIKKKEQIAKLEAKQQIIRDSQKKRAEIEASYLSLSDDEQEFFGIGKYARSTAVTDNQDDVNSVIDKETERRKLREERKELRNKPESARDEIEELDEPELSMEDAMKLYGSGIISLKRRTLLALLICIAMAYFTLAVEFKFTIPDLFLNNPDYFAIFFLSSLLVVLFLGIEIFISGLFDIFKARIGAESLVTVASIASIIDAIYIIITKDDSRGIPFCVVAAFSMLCTMWGSRLGKSAYRKTFKTISASQIPVVVSAEWEKIDEGIVLTKKYGTIKGFILKSTESDFAERAYSRLAPLLIIGALVFSLLSSVFKGHSQNFIHSFAAMTAVSASFSAMLAFNLPFSSIAKRLSGSGAAIAGWSGACDIEDAIGMVVKDTDLFPENAISLNGVKVFSDDSVEKVVSYAGSMILASGSGLTRIFADLLKEYACSIYRVDEFSCYEGGGIGAVIKGDRVLVGSAAFMNLMSIRLSSNLNIKSAVFIAINNSLAGVFIINYNPADAVKNALVALVRSKITPLFAVRDFNITPSMVKTKFQIPTDDIEFPTFEARYNLSTDSDNPDIKPTAIMSREGLGHFVEIVRGGRQLTSTVKKAVVLSVLGAIVGLLLMFFICWNGAFISGSAANALTFMLFWLLPVLLINGTGVRY